MDLFEKQAQLQSLFQTSPVDAAYGQGTPAARKLAGAFADQSVGLLLHAKVRANEFFDYQVYFVSELSKTLETEGLDVVILNQASLLQRAQVIRSWSLLFQRDHKRRVQWEARAVMEYLEFQKYHDILDAIGKHGIIDKQLAYRLEHLANLRNLLAYDREQTDIDEVYTSVQTRVGDLLAFADQIERFIGADATA